MIAAMATQRRRYGLARRHLETASGSRVFRITPPLAIYRNFKEPCRNPSASVAT